MVWEVPLAIKYLPLNKYVLLASSVNVSQFGGNALACAVRGIEYAADGSASSFSCPLPPQISILPVPSMLWLLIVLILLIATLSSRSAAKFVTWLFKILPVIDEAVPEILVTDTFPYVSGAILFTFLTAWVSKSLFTDLGSQKSYH